MVFQVRAYALIAIAVAGVCSCIDSSESTEWDPEEDAAEAREAVGGAIALPGRVQAEDFRLGGEGVAYHDTTAGNIGGAYRIEDVDIQVKAGGDGYNVGWIEAGEWLAYDVTVATPGTYSFMARVASGRTGTKKLRLELDGQIVGTGSFTDASGWQSWITVDLGERHIAAGSHRVRLVAETAGFNINSFEAALTAADPDDGMWIGAAVNRPDNTIGSWEARSASYGPYRIRRSFDSGLPSSIEDTPAADDAENGIITFLSVKPPSVDAAIAGEYDDEIRSLAASFPRDHTTYLTTFHEPENNMSGATFVKLFRRFYSLVKAENPNILVGTVHMSYQWRPGSSTTADQDSWWVGSQYTDFIGVDDYNQATASGRTTAATDPQFQRWYGWAKTKGEPLAVVEFGRLENPNDPQARARDLLDTEAWLDDEGFFMFLYWDAVGGGYDWRLETGPTQDAMRGIASRGLTGW